jgi:hypothetical protein
MFRIIEHIGLITPRGTVESDDILDKNNFSLNCLEQIT